MTKYDSDTGALSTDPKDIRVCTETVQEIQKRKSVETYELPDGNSDYPLGIYEKAVKYDVAVILSDMSADTMAFLNNAELTSKAGTMKDILVTEVPATTPYTIELLGKVATDTVPTVVDMNNTKLEKAEAAAAGKFAVTAGETGSPDTLTFDASDAGKPIVIEYDYNATTVEKYSESKIAQLPTVLLEIVHETLSSDKTKKYRNNTILKKMQFTGSYDETLKREHSPETLNFTAVRPNGVDVAENKKVEIPKPASE